ncbi:nuclear transport factor 2 family protein [Micromonospora sp. NPDC048909]|uniref:nuclear transport factor 2 family protein n=1 Tax=Micromonospora sp. NPDC048909 TaxID=3155643 RepID=UPI00340CF741
MRSPAFLPGRLGRTVALLGLAAGLLAVAPAAVSAAAPGPTAGDDASAGHGDDAYRGCERAFDRAVRAYVDTTARRDLDGFAALLHPDVTSVFASDGEVLDGKRATVDWLRGFFADDSWTQSFSVAKRTVVGCRTGFVLFDSVYAVPASGTRVPLLIGVSFTYQHGRWLVLQNQDSVGRI